VNTQYIYNASCVYIIHGDGLLHNILYIMMYRTCMWLQVIVMCRIESIDVRRNFVKTSLDRRRSINNSYTALQYNVLRHRQMFIIIIIIIIVILISKRNLEYPAHNLNVPVLVVNGTIYSIIKCYIIPSLLILSISTVVTAAADKITFRI